MVIGGRRLRDSTGMPENHPARRRRPPMTTINDLPPHMRGRRVTIDGQVYVSLNEVLALLLHTKEGMQFKRKRLRWFGLSAKPVCEAEVEWAGHFLERVYSEE